MLGVAAMTAARTLSFIYSVSDKSLPPIPPLLWFFHQADKLFIPGANRLPNLSAMQDVQCVALAVSLVLFFLAARAGVPALLRRHYRPLAFVCLALAVLLEVLALQGTLPFPVAIGTHHYGNDAVTVTSCASDEFLAGANPYRAFRVGPCLYQFGMNGSKTTPLQAGAFKSIRIYPTKQQLNHEFNLAVEHGWQFPAEFESYYSYPAASFIVPAIAMALRLRDLSVVYMLCFIALVVLVIRKARSETARRLIVIVATANAALWPTMASGVTDAFYSLLVLVAWMTRRQRWISSLAFGLAVSSRQQAWLFLIFFAILILRTEGRKELLWRLGIIAGIFLVTNLPYLVASPGPWLEGVFGPMRDPMFPRGTGIIALSTGGAGALPLGPRSLYDALEGIALLASAAYYWRICRTNPGTGLVLAPVALFFAWRSLYSYFLPISLLVLYPALVEQARPPVHGTGDEQTDTSPLAEAAA
jgi:hypothetical protein